MLLLVPNSASAWNWNPVPVTGGVLESGADTIIYVHSFVFCGRHGLGSSSGFKFQFAILTSSLRQISISEPLILIKSDWEWHTLPSQPSSLVLGFEEKVSEVEKHFHFHEKTLRCIIYGCINGFSLSTGLTIELPNNVKGYGMVLGIKAFRI